MAFKAIRLDSGSGLSATFVPGAGMVGVSLEYEGREFLDRRNGLGSYVESGSTLGLPILYPWANRLARDSWKFGPQPARIDPGAFRVRRDENGLAIHGTLAASSFWEVEAARAEDDLGSASLKAVLDFGAHPELMETFPFPHRLELQYRLAGQTLTVTTTVTPTGDLAVPLAYGFHPYLALTGNDRSEWTVRIPAMIGLESDFRHVPTGNTEMADAFEGPLADVDFDDAYTGVAEGAEFSAADAEHQITVRFERGFPAAQVYAPAGEQFICFEPMKAPTNALVSGRDLSSVEPGESDISEFSIKIGEPDQEADPDDGSETTPEAEPVPDPQPGRELEEAATGEVERPRRKPSFGAASGVVSGSSPRALLPSGGSGDEPGEPERPDEPEGPDVPEEAQAPDEPEETIRQQRRFRIDPEDPVSEVRRVASGRVDSAVSSLRLSPADDRAKAVHTARKDMKKLRSVLRLVRDELGKKTYREENRRYREAARLLSQTRDSEVLSGTLDSVLEDYPAGAPPVDALITEMAERRQLAASTADDSLADTLGEAADRIEAGGEQIAEWPLERSDWRLFEPGLKRSYGGGRKDLEAVRPFHSRGRLPESETMHDLRKRVKDLWYEMRLLREAWPEGLEGTVDELSRLAELLGDYNDLSVLREEIESRPVEGDPAENLSVLVKVIEARQQKMLDEAIPVARRIYAEKPDAFTARIGAYWSA